MGNFYTYPVEIVGNVQVEDKNNAELDSKQITTNPRDNYMAGVPASKIGFSQSCDFCIEIYDTNKIVYKDEDKNIGWIVCEQCTRKSQALSAMKGFYTE